MYLAWESLMHLAASIKSHNLFAGNIRGNWKNSKHYHEINDSKI